MNETPKTNIKQSALVYLEQITKKEERRKERPLRCACEQSGRSIDSNKLTLKMIETKRLKSVLIESSTSSNPMSYCIIREKKLKKVAKHEEISVNKLSSYDRDSHLQRSNNKSRYKDDVNKQGDHGDVAMEPALIMNARCSLRPSSSVIDSNINGYDGKPTNFNSALACRKNISLPSLSIQPPLLSASKTTSSQPQNSTSILTNVKYQPATTISITTCQSIGNQKQRNLHDATSSDNPPEKLTKLNVGRNCFGLDKRSNCLSFILALIVLCLSAQSNKDSNSYLSTLNNNKLQLDIRQERQQLATNYPEAFYNSITNLAQNFLIKQIPRIILAEAQYKPEWPSKTLQQEIFLLNLEDGYFGCQVNESQDFLQLFELSRLCDGQTQCYLGTDEMVAPLKCNNRESCSTHQNSRGQQENIQCVNGVCLDGLCYCNDGFGGKSCDVPDENECKFRPCDVFAHCTNTMGSYYCSCFPGKLPKPLDLFIY